MRTTRRPCTRVFFRTCGSMSTVRCTPASERGGVEGATAGVENEQAEKERVRAQLKDLRDTVARAAQKPRIDQAIALLDRVKGDPGAQKEFVGKGAARPWGREL